MRNGIKIITVLAKIAAVVAGLAAYTDQIPPSWLPYAVAVFAGASVCKDVFISIGDYMDDGKKNNSFKV